MHVLIAIVVALLIAAFVFWILTTILNMVKPYLNALLAQVAELIIIAIAVGIVLFYVVIPLLHMLEGVNLPTLH